MSKWGFFLEVKQIFYLWIKYRLISIVTIYFMYTTLFSHVYVIPYSDLDGRAFTMIYLERNVK
jgi:hypothetical protein